VCQKDFLTARFTECLCGFVVQIGGIRFLYDNIIESTSRYRTSPGFGCILAHSMGLGKTMQVSFNNFFRFFIFFTGKNCILKLSNK
jgi:hypothetical protein